MKQWNNPEIMVLNLGETAHETNGANPDGGYIGDGLLYGHLTPDKPVNPLS